MSSLNEKKEEENGGKKGVAFDPFGFRVKLNFVKPLTPRKEHF